MTTALCFNCGKLKFGALCPCTNCEHEPESISDAALLFTDHYMPGQFLKLLGKDLEKLKALETNEEIVLKAFFIHAKQLLKDEDSESIKIIVESKEAEELLKKANLPKHNIDEIEVKQERQSKAFCFIIVLLLLIILYLFFKVIQKVLR